MARARDDLIDLVTRQLAALTGLRALGHFDLDFVRVDQVVSGYTEAAARDLFDGAAAQVAVRVALEALLVLAAFAGVGHAAESIHGDCQSLLGLRSEEHT